MTRDILNFAEHPNQPGSTSGALHTQAVGELSSRPERPLGNESTHSKDKDEEFDLKLSEYQDLAQSELFKVMDTLVEITPGQPQLLTRKDFDEAVARGVWTENDRKYLDFIGKNFDALRVLQGRPGNLMPDKNGTEIGFGFRAKGINPSDIPLELSENSWLYAVTRDNQHPSSEKMTVPTRAVIDIAAGIGAIAEGFGAAAFMRSIGISLPSPLVIGEAAAANALVIASLHGGAKKEDVTTLPVPELHWGEVKSLYGDWTKLAGDWHNAKSPADPNWMKHLEEARQPGY